MNPTIGCYATEEASSSDIVILGYSFAKTSLILIAVGAFLTLLIVTVCDHMRLLGTVERG